MAKIAPVVIEEIEETVLYIAKDSVIDAVSWSFEIQKKIQSLEQFPARCPIAEESQLLDYDMHHLIIGNFRVLFRIEEATVKVLHLRSGWQSRKLI
jgi:toxin ParE1/3/4